MINRLSRSLSFRLLLIFAVLGSLFVFGTFKAIQRFYNSDQIRGLISGHLSLHVNYVREDIGEPPRLDRALAITQEVPVDIRILGPDVDWASDENFPRLDELQFATSPNFGDDPGAWADELPGVDFAALNNHDFLRMRKGDYQIVVATPKISAVSNGPALVPLVIGLGLTLLILAYLAVSWLFRPIRVIRKGAEHIGKGNFEHRIARIRRDQLGDLAADINAMAGDVQNMLDAKRTLLLGISHELRTPLSRMRLALEFVDDKESADTLRAEVREMEKIVVALVEAERLNSRHEDLARTEVVFGDMIELLIEDFFFREAERLEVDLPEEPIVAQLDEARVALLFKNLIRNALRYAPAESGPVRVSARVEAHEIVATVSDNGPGLSQDQADHLGEPFYRSDTSRTRQSGGTGLGLYLATLVANAHGGSLSLLDSGANGACFEVRLPIL